MPLDYRCPKQERCILRRGHADACSLQLSPVSIFDLRGLPERIANRLNAVGIVTVQAVCQFKPSELLNLPGFGRTSLKILTHKLWVEGAALLPECRRCTACGQRLPESTKAP